MCATCGCGDDGATRVTTFHDHPSDRGHPHDHLSDHGHPDSHGHLHDHGHAAAQSPAPVATRTLQIEQQVLAKNDLLAAGNRGWLAGRGISALNMMSSPGSGKTSLLVRTIREIDGAREVAVIEGDQETVLDADRIRATGAPVVQINTGAGCHLDAEMFERGLRALDPPAGSLLFVENVGNLVCPALFDLGETAKVVVISVTEGDDKPLKYPQMFAAADVLVINKTDLLPYVDFDVDACAAHARLVNRDLAVLPLSVTSGAGMDGWFSWLTSL
jgi:hydrogenase nickel incorporation protein HypB